MLYTSQGGVIVMSKQKFYTPLANRKGRESSYRKEEGEDNYNTEPNKPRALEPIHSLLPDKIKSNPSFSLDRMSTRTIEIARTSLLSDPKRRQLVKLPSIKLKNNPQEGQPPADAPKLHYVSSLERCLRKHETTYLMNLYRQHFYQCVEVLRMGRSIKLSQPRKELKLPRKNPALKTVFLDLDETLIHCDENSNNYTVKLNFPLERGGTLAAGIRVRPYCREFLEQLSQLAEVIIFTASAASYADVVLDYLDPEKKWISHRLYRQHCTLERGYYLKDLRVVNRRPQDVVLVDNSPYCHILQPENAVPIVPFYHYARDNELETLLEFLRTVIQAEDTRKVVLGTYYWDRLINESGDARRLFLKNCCKE